MKAPPTTYVMHFTDGKVKAQGPGLSFFYYAPTSTIVWVPLGSRDAQFVFNETAADFQAVTIQGQLTYRVVEPQRLASLLDFTVDGDGRWVTEDPDALEQRLVQ